MHKHPSSKCKCFQLSTPVPALAQRMAQPTYLYISIGPCVSLNLMQMSCVFKRGGNFLEADDHQMVIKYAVFFRNHNNHRGKII